MKNIKLDQVLSIDTKKTTKINAFNTLLNFVDDNSDNLAQYELKELYTALKTIYPATKAREVSDYWKLLVKFAGKKDVRYYLNGIFIQDEKTLVASNGYALCKVELKENHSLSVGSLYEPQNEKIVSMESGDFKYPCFDKAFNGETKSITDSFDIEKINNGYDRKVNNTLYNEISGHYFDNKYLKMIPANYSNIYMIANKNGIYDVLMVEVETEQALIKLVIMPARI